MARTSEPGALPTPRLWPNTLEVFDVSDYIARRLADALAQTRTTESGCWESTLGVKSDTGYAMINIDGKPTRKHRFVYEQMAGPIPEGLYLDHLCRNRACCNPDHLELVTHKENSLRGVGIAAQRARQTHCIHGHEFAGDNLYRPPSRPWARLCRTCMIQNSRDRRGRPNPIVREPMGCCNVEGCERAGYARLMCQPHYNAWYRARRKQAA